MSMNKEYLRGHRAEKMIDIDGDFGFDQEEFDRVIEAFCSVQEQCIISKELYVSSACNGEIDDRE